MNLFARALERRDATFTLKDPAMQALRDWFGVGNTAGVSVSPTTAEGLPVVFGCVGLLADLIADTPLKVYRKLPRGKEPDPKQSLYSILHDLPNPMMTAFDFRQPMQWWLGLWGNAYAFIDRYPGGDVKGLWPLQSDRMKVDFDKGGSLVYEYNKGASKDTWTWDSRRPPILHLRCYSRDGIHGRSPVTVLRESFAEAQAAREFSTKLFADGLLGTVFASYPGQLKAGAKQNLRESIKERFGRGIKTAHAVGILEEGLKIERVSMPPKDAQFLELRQATDEQLARAFRIPPFLIGLMQQAGTYGVGLEQQVLGFLKFTAGGWFKNWEQACNRDLLTYKSYETHECLFVRNALVQADITARTQAYERQIKYGGLSPNESRELENMNPREGGDEYVSVEAVASGGVAKKDEDRGVLTINERRAALGLEPIEGGDAIYMSSSDVPAIDVNKESGAST